MPKLSFQYVRQELTETLLEFLSRRFKYHSVVEWSSRIEAGAVLVNGKAGNAGRLLETRDKIVYLRPPGPEPEVDASYTVLYEDDHLLAVRKSGNIPSTPSGKYWDNCLVHVLQRETGYPVLLATHRLDRETSGINLFAKSKEAARVLGKMFQHGGIEKAYQTVVVGDFPHRDKVVDLPLGGDREGSIRIKQVHDPAGRPAQTAFRLLARLPGASLVEARPITGRTHQIRAHLACLGHPVWGDRLYGGSEEAFIAFVSQSDRNAESRQLLHATRLSFAHPITGDPVIIEDNAGAIMDLFWEGLTRQGVQVLNQDH